jgi:hypothetical protein
VKKIKINLAIVILIIQFIGYDLPSFSMTLDRKEAIDSFDLSKLQDDRNSLQLDDFIDRVSLSNLSKSFENILPENLLNNCFESLSCQKTTIEERETLVFKLNSIASFKSLKINGNNSDPIGIGYVPILARSESGDIDKDVYYYDLNLDREFHNNALVLSASTESLNFFINPKKKFSYNSKTVNSNNFKIATAFKYDSFGGIKALSKGKKTKTSDKTISLKILPSNYSALKTKVSNYSGKQNFGKSTNSTIAKALPKDRVTYSVTDRYQSQIPLWQRQIDRKLASTRQQLANQQRQFRIKMEQNIEQSYREQQRQQENLAERTMQELRQDLIKQQQQQLQPIQNYY